MHFVIKRQQIDGYFIFSGKVLLRSGQKCLCEIESGQPKYVRHTVHVPFLNYKTTLLYYICDTLIDFVFNIIQNNLSKSYA